MQFTESRSEGLLRVYDVVVPKADLESRLAAKIEEVQPRVKINGFRPGKVPASHIRKMYGPSMMQDIINETVQQSTQASIEKANLKAASQPSLDLKSDLAKVASGEEDLAFEVSFEVMPDFEPADLKSISVTRPIAPVEDSQIDEALAEIAKSQRSFEDKDGASEDGDAVVVDFVGKLDGEAFDGGSANDAVVVLGSNQFIPGFEEQLVGVKAGDEKVLNVTFPEGYAAQNLAGRAATFETTVKQVRKPKETEINDELATQLGLADLQALKDAIRSRIESDHTSQSRAKAKRALFDELDKLHDFPLPPRMLDAEFNLIWRQVEADRAAGRSDPTDEGKSEDALKAEYRRIAGRRVRLGLLLAEIGRRNGIQVSDQEVGQAIAAQARNYPGRERQIYEMYQKNPNLVAQARAPIFEEKVVDFVLELVQTTKETVTREALFADDEDEIGG